MTSVNAGSLKELGQKLAESAIFLLKTLTSAIVANLNIEVQLIVWSADFMSENGRLFIEQLL